MALHTGKILFLYAGCCLQSFVIVVTGFLLSNDSCVVIILGLQLLQGSLNFTIYV